MSCAWEGHKWVSSGTSHGRDIGGCLLAGHGRDIGGCLLTGHRWVSSSHGGIEGVSCTRSIGG